MRLHYLILITLLFSCLSETKLTSTKIKTLKEKVASGNIKLTSHVYINTIVNDSIKAVFLFDSGANGLVLDKTFLVDIGMEKDIISLSGNYTYGVGESRTQHQTISEISVTIDNKTFSDLELRVMPLDSMFSEMLQHKIDGIIGWDIFDEYIINIDFDNHLLSLKDTISEIEKSTYERLEFKNDYRKPFIQTIIRISETKIINSNLMFDMGSGRGISLTHKKGLTEDLFDKNLLCEVDSISGMGGISENCYLAAKALEIGEYKIAIDTIEIGKDKNGALGLHTMYDGLMGMDVINKFNVLIDSNESTIWLKKR